MKKSAAVLKGLLVQKSRLDGEIIALNEEIKERQREKALKVRIVKEISAKIKDYNSDGNIIVTEHALIQYLSRVLNLDFEKIKKEILSDTVMKQIGIIGNSGKFPNTQHGIQFKVVIDNGNVVTIVT